MAKLCPHCRGDITPFPLFKKVGDKKKPLWKNWFRIDLVSALFFISILLMAWGYKHDTQECREFINTPCAYAEEKGCMNNYLKLNQSEIENKQYEPSWTDINLSSKSVT